MRSALQILLDDALGCPVEDWIRDQTPAKWQTIRDRLRDAIPGKLPSELLPTPNTLRVWLQRADDAAEAASARQAS